jgi:hypothetical protein
MTLLAGTMRFLRQPSDHVARAFISGHLVVLVLFAGAIFIGLLLIPVIGDVISGAIEGPAARWSPLAFAIGLGVLILGLVAGVRILDILGAGLMGAVVLGALTVHY